MDLQLKSAWCNQRQKWIFSFESIKLSTPWGYVSTIVLCIATFGTIALISRFFLKPNATFDDYIADVLPLFGGFLSILDVSEVLYIAVMQPDDDGLSILQTVTMITATCCGVKLSPSFLIPSNWTGSLGKINNYESLLPCKKALFDNPVARTANAYLTSLALALTAFVADGSLMEETMLCKSCLT